MAGFHVEYLEEEEPRVFFVNCFPDYSYDFSYRKPGGAVFRGASFDLRGLGKAVETEHWERHVERLAEDLKAMVDTLEPGWFILAGHGRGGAVISGFCERFGREYPGKLKGLAVIEHDGPSLSESRLLSKLFQHLYRHPTGDELCQALADKTGDSSLYYVCIRCNIRRITIDSPTEELYGQLFDVHHGD